jgi:hypothetical protein
MSTEITSSVPLSIKGVINVQLIKDDIVIEEKTYTNLFLDNGVKNWINASYPSYLYLSYKTNPQTPMYTDTSIPYDSGQLYGGYAVTRTVETTATYYRHRFTTTNNIPAPGVDRTYNVIGLGASNTNMYCYTILTTPLIQGANVQMSITYYIYFDTAITTPGISSDFFYTLIGGGYNVRQFIIISGPKEASLPGFFYYNSSPAANVTVNTTKYKWSCSTSWGSSGNTSGAGWLGSGWGISPRNAGYYLSLLGTSNSVPLKGRVFAKKKTSTSTHYESDVNYQPTGYPYAVETKISNVNKMKWYQYFYLYPTVSGQVGTSKYYLREKSFIRTCGYIYDSDGNTSYPGSFPSGWFQKYGKKLMFLPSRSVGYTADCYVHLLNPDYGTKNFAYLRVSHSTNDHTQAISYLLNNNIAYPDSFFLVKPIDVYYNSSQTVTYGNILKYTFRTPGDFNSIYLEKSITIENNNPIVNFAFLGNDGCIYYNFGGNKLKKADINNPDNPIVSWYDNIFWTQVNCGTFSHYDSATNKLYAPLDSGVHEFNVDGSDATNNVIGDIDLTRLDSFNRYYKNSGKIEIVPLGYKITLPISSNLTTSADDGTSAYIFFDQGNCEVKCKLSNFNPTTNYQALGLIIRDLYSRASYKGIFWRYNSGIKLETINSNGTEASITFNNSSVWLKIVKTGQVVTCYYSTDDVTYNLLGNTTYALSSTNDGKFMVGIYGTTFGQTIASQISGICEQFTVVSGNINNKTKTSYVDDDCITYVWYNSPGHQSVITLPNGKRFVIGKNKILQYDNATKGYTITRVNLPTTYAYGKIAYDPESTYVLFIVKNTLLYYYSEPQETFSSSNAVYYIYDTENDNFARIGVDLGSRFYVYNTSIHKNQMLIYSKYYYQGFYLYTNYYYDWDSTLNKWKLVDDPAYGYTPVGKLTHSDWQDIPFGMQIRFNNHPSTPENTLSTNDMYTFDACSHGILKDNLQYIPGGITGAVYVCGTQYVQNRTFSLSSTTYTLPEVTSDPNFLIYDFDFKYNVMLYNSDDTFAYTQDLYTTASVNAPDTSSPKSKFTFNYTGSSPSPEYGYYNNMYIKFTSGANANTYRKIVEYDFHRRTIVTEAFPSNITAGDTFVIMKPIPATKVTTVNGSNQFAVNENTGVLTFSTADVGKKVIMSYIYLKRTW